jgi:hypothetical protein
MISTAIPQVDFCGLRITRLVLGANPFGGFSHQSAARDSEMLGYYSVERIKETWLRAEAAGINAMVTNNETPHVVQAVTEYLGDGGNLQWIAQVSCRTKRDMHAAIDEAVRIGCRALYFHGALVDDAYSRRDAALIEEWCGYARAAGVPAGVAAHAPEAHLWVNEIGAADFHAVCFFNCGSLHAGGGEKFRLADVAPAAECTRRIEKPCIAYKIMGAGRIAASMAFEYAFEHIKHTDVVNVGMHRGDNDDIVEENAGLVREILSREILSREAATAAAPAR